MTLQTIAISLLLAPVLMACSSPSQQSHRIGSAVYRSEAAAEAALTKAKSTQVSDAPADEEIRLLRAPMPGMPTEAVNADLKDQVTVNILFNEEGDAESVVPRSYKYPVLLNAVLAVVSNWRIEPRVEAGRRIKTTVQQSFQFETR